MYCRFKFVMRLACQLSAVFFYKDERFSLFHTFLRPARVPTQASFSIAHSASRQPTRRIIAAGIDKLQLSDRRRTLYMHIYCNVCLLSYINRLSSNAVCCTYGGICNGDGTSQNGDRRMIAHTRMVGSVYLLLTVIAHMKFYCCILESDQFEGK